MLVIRTEQFTALGKARKEQFIRQLLEHLRNHFADKLLAPGVVPEGLEAMVRQGIAKAEKHGIENDTDLRAYLEFQAILGIDFEQGPGLSWAKAILEDKQLSGSSKIDEINQHLLFGPGGPQ